MEKVCTVTQIRLGEVGGGGGIPLGGGGGGRRTENRDHIYIYIPIGPIVVPFWDSLIGFLI